MTQHRTCPGCGCIHWPPNWTAVHRRNCEYEGTDPSGWGK